MTTTPAPSLSVIIRTYNRADRLERAIRSVLAQDWPVTQVIVMDDGSTDHTRQVVAAFPQVEYHYQENAGLQGCRHTALGFATGEFLAYLDSDDEWQTDFLTRGMELFERFPEAGLVFSNFEKRTFDGAAEASNFDRFPLLRPYLKADPAGAHFLTPEALRAIYILHIPAPSSAIILRRALVPDHWRGVVKTADDWMEALDMIFRHHIAGAFWACPRWIKWCGRDSMADGAHDALYRARNRTHDRAIMLDNYAAFMTPAEIAVMKDDVVEHNFDAGYQLAQTGDIRPALQCFWTAFKLRPSLRHAAALAKTCLKAVLPRRG